MLAIKRVENARAAEALTIARTAQGEAKDVSDLMKKLLAR